MEEQSTTSTTAAAAADFRSVDPSLERKHAAMLDRLNRLHESRSTAPKSTNTSTDSVQSFLSEFSAAKLSITSALSQIPHSQNPKSDLQQISLKINHLETLTAQNSYLLPPYELRTSLSTITDLKQNVDVLTSQLIPKKKFSFKSKKSTTTTFPQNTPHIVENVSHNNDNNSVGLAAGVYDAPGFKGLRNEVLVKEFRSDEEEIGEFMLSELSDCEVRLLGSLRALFVHKLVNCRVYVGAVFGSVLIEEVEGCVFVMASHQIRIHYAKMTDFYLRVRSRPIIEDCSGVRFAPYCLEYEGIEGDLNKANLEEETGNWANVDDFRWLRAVQSPNWSVLPECDRIGTVSISGSEG